MNTFASNMFIIENMDCHWTSILNVYLSLISVLIFGKRTQIQHMFNPPHAIRLRKCVIV